ncbi:MAG: hypothetical protein GVY36_01860 [Verrucomicrobia bacterium]|jgi:hypothetical protein|nr:hypothetical protein [Verrucomicrobiota bacterium]
MKHHRSNTAKEMCLPLSKLAVFFIWIMMTVAASAQEELLFSARATGETNGRIALLTVRNSGTSSATVPERSFYVPGTPKRQALLLRYPPTTIPAGQSREIPATGYCIDVHKSAYKQNEELPPNSSWIAASPQGPSYFEPFLRDGLPQEKAPATIATLPDSSIPIHSRADGFPPEVKANLFVTALDRIERTVDTPGIIRQTVTPYAGEEERKLLVQQTLWAFAASARGITYGEAEFSEQLAEQVKAAGGNPSEPETEKQTADIWDAVKLV